MDTISRIGNQVVKNLENGRLDVFRAEAGDHLPAERLKTDADYDANAFLRLVPACSRSPLDGFILFSRTTRRSC